MNFFRSFLAQNLQDIERNGNGDSNTNSPRRSFTGRKAKALDLAVVHKTVFFC